MTHPIIGIVAIQKTIENHHSQTVNHKFLQAVSRHGGSAIILPAQLAENKAGLENVLSTLSGVVLTGDYSNVAPERYNATHVEEKTDLPRDSLAFGILDIAKKSGLPVLGICRGHQEINVSYGGTLYPKLYEIEGLLEHREDNSQPQDVQYANRQLMTVKEKWLKALVGKDEFLANTLHGQGINVLGKGLSNEAEAKDGIIECIKASNHPFMVGTQFHIEWKPEINPVHSAIWDAFIEAAKVHLKN